MTLICAKFDADVIDISKAINQSSPAFLAYLVHTGEQSLNASTRPRNAELPMRLHIHIHCPRPQSKEPAQR